MDKITLTKEQLQKLSAFIRKKGFKEPLLIVEILDHFACKVEEKLTANTSLSFDEAIISAHRDFGVAGFAPLVKAYEQELKKKYRTIYRAELKKVMKNPIYILPIALTCFLFYKGFVWAEIKNYQHVVGINDVGLLAYILTIIVGPYSTLNKYGQKRVSLRGNPIAGAIWARSFWAFIVMSSITIQPNYEMMNTRQLLLSSIIGTIGVCVSMIAILTMRSAMEIGYSESVELNNYLKEIEN